MPVHLRPVGPLPEAVYWRRRAGVVVLLVLLLVLLSRCGGDDPAPEALEQQAPVSASADPTPDATATPAASTTPTATPSAGAACADADLTVRAVPERASYAEGARPVLRLQVRNAGATPCTRALGGSAVELTVVSGPDRIWSSDDCSPGGEPGPELLAVQEVHTITVVWDGRRSRPGCAGERERIESGTYRVVGRVGAVRSAGSAFVVR